MQNTTDIQFLIVPSSLGQTLIATSANKLCALFFGDDRQSLLHALRARFAYATLQEGGAEVAASGAKVAAWLEAPVAALDVPLDLRGTEFQQSVWNALREIPAGSTASYTDIANRIGRPKSVRAVAQACGANPVAVIVPCHRVIRSDGALSGYRWGVGRKRVLLEREMAWSNDQDQSRVRPCQAFFNA